MKLLNKLNEIYLKNALKNSENRRDFNDARRYVKGLESECNIHLKNEIPRLYLKQAKEQLQPAHVKNAAREFEKGKDLNGAVNAYLSCRGMKGDYFNFELGKLEIKRGNLNNAIDYFKQEYCDPEKIIFNLEYYCNVSEKFPNLWESKKKELFNESIKYSIEEIQNQRRKLNNLETELNEKKIAFKE